MWSFLADLFGDRATRLMPWPSPSEPTREQRRASEQRERLFVATQATLVEEGKQPEWAPDGAPRGSGSSR